MRKLIILIALCHAPLVSAAPDIAEPVRSVYDNVIVKNADDSVDSCKQIKLELEGTQPDSDNAAVDAAFQRLVLSWKKVEATYIAGDLDQNYLDTPRFIDVFHNSNEDLSAIMQRQLSSSSVASKALFKNSFKTVNALEAVLYDNDTLSAREIEFAGVMVDSICAHLQEIAQVYTKHRQSLLADPEKALSLYTHALSNSIFATKDWRIGDPAGLSRKYKNQPSAKRSEYALSGYSVAAIQAIFEVHQEIMGQQDYANLQDVIRLYQADQLADEILLTLTQISQQLALLHAEDYTFQPDLTVPLYDGATQLYKHYYVSLLSALPITSRILEADGD